MKRTWKQGIAAVMIAGLLLSFAACQKKPNDGKITTTLPTNTVSETAQTSTEATTQMQALSEPLSSTTKAVTTKRTVQTTGRKGGGSGKDTPKAPAPQAVIKTPKNTAEALALYKSAVSGVKTSCKFSRTLDSAKVMDIDITEMGFAELFNRTNDSPAGVKLPSLSSNEVSSASISATEKEIAIRFSLKDYTGDYNAKHGAGGYACIDISETGEILNSALGGVSGNDTGMSVSKGQSDVTMSSGIWTVSISKSTGKIVNAAFSYRENVRLRVTGNIPNAGPVAGNLTLISHGAGTFKILS